MDRAGATGLGVSVAAHAALLAALSLGLANARLPQIQSDPMEVSFVEDVGLVSAAPSPALAEPAPKLAEVEAPVEPTPTPLVEPVLAQPKAVTPTPPRPLAQRPAERQRPAAKAPQAQPKQKAKAGSPARSGGRLKGLLDGVSDRPSPSRSTAPAAQVAGPAVQASLGGEVRRQLKPHWRSPSGADVDLLRTTVQVRLARDGSLAGEPRVLRQTGVNDSNRAQAEVHAERAIRAVKLAAPFNLPAEYYDAWKVISPIFDKRL